MRELTRHFFLLLKRRAAPTDSRESPAMTSTRIPPDNLPCFLAAQPHAGAAAGFWENHQSLLLLIPAPLRPGGVAALNHAAGQYEGTHPGKPPLEGNPPPDESFYHSMRSPISYRSTYWSECLLQHHFDRSKGSHSEAPLLALRRSDRPQNKIRFFWSWWFHPNARRVPLPSTIYGSAPLRSPTLEAAK